MNHTLGKLRQIDYTVYSDEYIVADTLRGRQAYGPSAATDFANAARLAHCWNLHDELVAALQNLYELVVEREQGNHDLDEELDAAEAALAAAKGEADPN